MYNIINITKNGKELYVTHHQLENGMWRSCKKEDARIFLTYQAALNFINKMKYTSTFKIVKL